jgi:hypothetical protein
MPIWTPYTLNSPGPISLSLKKGCVAFLYEQMSLMNKKLMILKRRYCWEQACLLSCSQSPSQPTQEM